MSTLVGYLFVLKIGLLIKAMFMFKKFSVIDTIIHFVQHFL